jgi:hypothetical protein
MVSQVDIDQLNVTDDPDEVVRIVVERHEHRLAAS